MVIAGSNDLWPSLGTVKTQTYTGHSVRPLQTRKTCASLLAKRLYNFRFQLGTYQSARSYIIATAAIRQILFAVLSNNCVIKLPRADTQLSTYKSTVWIKKMKYEMINTNAELFPKPTSTQILSNKYITAHWYLNNFPEKNLKCLMGLWRIVSTSIRT
jgi:hypothetical protein